ncbi:MAG: GAF domain-containing protein [Anaerolineaceae bacterium]|nr:GAF domain-containing protein [Anaerolineaceae bacterium]
MNFFQRFVNHLSPTNLPPQAQQREEIQRQREIILQYNLNGLFGLGLLGVILGFGLTIQQSSVFDLIFYPAIIVAIGVVTINRKLPYRLRALSFVSILAIIGTVMLFRQALSGNGILFLLTFIVLTGVLFGQRAGTLSLLGLLVYLLAFGYLMSKSIIDMPRFDVLVNSGQFTAWMVTAIAFLYCGVAVVLSINVFLQGLSDTLQKQKKLSTDLEAESRSLETRVQQRTDELNMRITRMDAARRIGNEISAESTMDDLLNKAVNIIREEFSFYHAGLFLNDEKNEFAILRAATGEAGAAMLQREHRLKIGEIGIVGYVTSKGESRITADVTQDPNHFKNPLLPDTASEIAVPLRIGERIIGALDVQSTQRNPFSPVDVEVLQIIADQLATAVDKARLLESFQQSLQELEGTYRQSTQQSWQNFLRNARKSYGFQYRESEVAPHASLAPEAEQALRQANLVATPLEPGVTAIAVPISLRGQPIGVVNLRFASTRLSPEMIELVRDATDRLAVSLENARLLEEIQFRAQRERLVGDVSSKVRAATDVESILRIAANELGQSLGVAEVVVQLHSPD